MPPSKNAQLRYLALDKCLRNSGRRYTINDLLAECNKALREFNGAESEIKKRQLYEDLKFMESENGYQAPVERKRDGNRTFYRYTDKSFSITNQPLNETESRQLRDALLVLNRFEGLPQFDWVRELVPRLEQSFSIGDLPKNAITFDFNPYLKGREFIHELFSAIQYENVLEVQYQPFSHPEVLVHEIHPYHLRQYNNRWFVFGYNPEYDDLSTLALDRILAIKEIDRPYRSATIDFDTYFEDIIGVTRPAEEEIQRIRLWVSPQQTPYIQTKPLHGSQRRIHEGTDGSLTIELELIPNYEFRQRLLGMGANVRVLAPERFRTEIRQALEQALAGYEAN